MSGGRSLRNSGNKGSTPITIATQNENEEENAKISHSASNSFVENKASSSSSQSRTLESSDSQLVGDALDITQGSLKSTTSQETHLTTTHLSAEETVELSGKNKLARDLKHLCASLG